MRLRQAISRPRSTRRWSTIRNSRAGSKSEHPLALGQRRGVGRRRGVPVRQGVVLRQWPYALYRWWDHHQSLGSARSPPSSHRRATMQAVVIHAARDLRVEEREAEAPGTGQLEIAVEAGGICGSALHYFKHGGVWTV